jgi:capsule biosynthesis phosphatase
MLRDNQRVIVCDVDDTICTTKNRQYYESQPILKVIEKLREARIKGYWIVLETARGQGRSDGNIELVRDEVMAELAEFCEKHSVPYDEIKLGKTWARYYIDDRSLRPDEFCDVEL